MASKWATLLTSSVHRSLHDVDRSVALIVNAIKELEKKQEFPGPAKFGSSSNYAQFDASGHLTLVGTAKPWDDLRIEPVARTTDSNAPSFSKWYDDVPGTSRGVYLYTFDNATVANQKEVFFTQQMPHSWDGGPINIHVHWIAATTASSSKVRWGLEYCWADVGTAFGDTTLVYADTDYAGSTGTTANVHTITSFTPITPSSSQNDISSILIGRLWRDSAHANDTYTGDAGLLYIDTHFQMSSLGSDNELTT